MIFSSRKRWIALVLLTVVEFILLLDSSIVNVALPSMKAGLHLSETDLGWVVNAYQLLFGGFLLLGGRAADLFGRRWLFVLGLALFTLGSTLAGLAPTALVLLGARGLQGLGAALVIPAEQGLVATIFTDPAEFNWAMGIWSAMGAAGAAFGVTLGGVLTQFAGWPWIFLVNVPIGILVLALAPFFLPRSQASEARKKLDLGGAFTITLATLLLGYAFGNASQGWLSLTVGGSLVLALALGGIFVWIEARSPAPLVPLRMFRLRNLNGADLVSLLIGAAHAPMFYFLSLYFQQVLGYGAFLAGVAVLPLAIVSIVAASTILSKALARPGYRGVLTLGMLLLAAGLLLFARVPVPGNYLLDVLPASLLVAIGLPAVFAGSNIAAVKAVPPTETSLASGLVNTAQRIGSGLGIMVLSSLAVARTNSLPRQAGPMALAGGFQVAFLGAAVAALLGAIIAQTVLRQEKGPHAQMASQSSEKITSSH